MSRFLILENIKKAASYARKIQRSTNGELKRDAAYANVLRKYSVACVNNFGTRNAQSAWRKLSQIGCRSRPSLSPLARAAQAFILASTRSHITVPAMSAFLFGELTMTQKAVAEANPSSRNNVYMSTEEGHAYAIQLLSSLLEALILVLRALYLVVLFSPCIEMAPLADRLGLEFRKLWPHVVQIPVASGSIAQVHRATLRFKYHGKEVKPIQVAVRVRHPGVGKSIRRDFVIINSVEKISTYIPTLKWSRLDESVQQFAVFMMSQVDLSREAAHLNRFIDNFRRWRDVSFPKPLYPLVHPAVLVETYEQGESVAHFIEELDGHDRIKAALAHIGTHALLKMLLVDNFVHADMHPGNILVRVVPKKSARKKAAKSKPHVVFIDVGMTAELSQGD
ncbi:putative serine/threonine-protein kinase abkC [Drosera capensis]